jgi:hypothetical protein
MKENKIPYILLEDNMKMAMEGTENETHAVNSVTFRTANNSENYV